MRIADRRKGGIKTGAAKPAAAPSDPHVPFFVRHGAKGRALPDGVDPDNIYAGLGSSESGGSLRLLWDAVAVAFQKDTARTALILVALAAVLFVGPLYSLLFG